MCKFGIISWVFFIIIVVIGKILMKDFVDCEVVMIFVVGIFVGVL